MAFGDTVRGSVSRAALMVLGIGMLSSSVLAGGFYSPYQSAVAVGAAFAGASARTDNPGFFLYNPAAAASFDGRESYFDFRTFAPQARISVDKAADPLGTAITNARSSSNLPATFAIAPGSVTMIPLARGLTLGFGASTPFATAVSARPGWAGRFHLLDAKMVGLRETVALGWQATPWLALGLGVQVERLDTRFTNAALIPVGPGAPLEATIRMKGSSWQAGPVAGAIIAPMADTRIGLAWHSAMPQQVSGKVSANLAGLPVEASRYTVHLPQFASLGVEQRVSDRLRLFGEAQWINWRKFKGFRITFPSGRPEEVRPIQWRDTYLFALGLGYKVFARTEITTGVSIETAAAINASGTTLSTDARQMTLGLGLAHDFAGWGKVSLNYALVLVERAKVKAQSPTSGLLEGKLNGRLHVVGLGYSIRW